MLIFLEQKLIIGQYVNQLTACSFKSSVFDKSKAFDSKKNTKYVYLSIWNIRVVRLGNRYDNAYSVRLKALT